MKAGEIDVETAFSILESAKQTEGDWITAFSFVYSKKDRAVHYCFDGYDERFEYKFPV